MSLSRILLFCFLCIVQQISCQRTLIAGEPCEPRFAESGAFGVCADAASDNAISPDAESSIATPVALQLQEDDSVERVSESDAQGRVDCCAALSEIGFVSTLPVMVIDTHGKEIPDEPKTDGLLCTCSDGAKEESVHRIGVEIRGSTSARDFAKKSYAVETRDASGADLDVSLLGFSNGSDWVLYGPELDKSMGMRNYLTMQLYRLTGRYASNTQYVEVFVVDDARPLSSHHYNGVYILMEKVKRGDNRVPIQKLSAEEDISGGYIFKYDNNNFDPGDQIFTSTESSLPFIVTYPSKSNIAPASLDYLAEYLGEVEAALLTENRSVWLDYVDEDSFVDMFLITELTKNPDAYRGSYYFHKNPGSVLIAGPPWDFNEAYGMCCGYPIEGYLNNGISNGISGGSAISPNGWRYNICTQSRRCLVDPTDGVSFWFKIMMEDAEFKHKVQLRWRALRSGLWRTETIRSYFASVRQEIELPVARNFDRWVDALVQMDPFIDEDTWQEEMATMEGWTIDRLAWMDAVLIEDAPSAPALAFNSFG